MEQPDIVVFEAPLGSDLYRQALALREAILRRPLGLTISAEELADDAARQHFCALWLGRVVGSVSLKPLGEALLQLKQMAVAEERQRRGVGRQLLSHAEDWGRTPASTSWCSTRGLAPRASTRLTATWWRASRSRRTRCRMSE